MTENEQSQPRPIGWWLKRADRLLDAAFDRALEGHDVDRRGWQVLASLARRPTSFGELVASLAPFDEPGVLMDVVDTLAASGWIEESDGRLRLTDDGRRQQAELAPLVDDVREHVTAALPAEDYVTLVHLLQQLADGLGEAFPDR
jgi:DNA-binding MarR family transcriptional regulator